MIALAAGTQVWIAAGRTDLRRGFTGLSAIVQGTLEQDPFSGHVFVFRGRRGDLLKVLWWDGDGMCLLAKRLEGGWPGLSGSAVSLHPPELRGCPVLFGGALCRRKGRAVRRSSGVVDFSTFSGWCFSTIVSTGVSGRS